MDQNPILRELRALRRAHAERFGYDIHATCEDLRQQQRAYASRIVRRPPKPLAQSVGHGCAPPAE